ncbi:MAG: hypothetical protein KDH15_11555 [Rhodocyclaceae bacterium]|nr:hypothetical protein [Rhodocyclaceae bacterium]
MRIAYLILILISISGCAAKPIYTLQSPTGLEVGLNRDTKHAYSLVDRNWNVVARARASSSKVIFDLDSHISPTNCYAVVDDEGDNLYGKSAGFKITAIYDYYQILRRLDGAEKEFSRCAEKESGDKTALSAAEAKLNSNQLFNGRTCNLPSQRAIPPFPRTICGNHSQCQRLASDACIKNLVDAESCGAALSQTNIHSSISSVGCGAILSALNGDEYGIGAGVQDAITGYLDEHTKSMINAGEYGNAIATGALRIALTYWRTENCKEQFFRAAYAPIERWATEKEYIEREPYIRQNSCNQLIVAYNNLYGNLERSNACVKNMNAVVASLSNDLQKARLSTSTPEACSIN